MINRRFSPSLMPSPAFAVTCSGLQTIIHQNDVLNSKVFWVFLSDVHEFSNLLLFEHIIIDYDNVYNSGYLLTLLTLNISFCSSRDLRSRVSQIRFNYEKRKVKEKPT